MIQEYNLQIGNGPTQYNPEADPRVSNEFATVIFSSKFVAKSLFSVSKVAFRFGHSQVHVEFRPWKNGQITGFPKPKPPPPAEPEHAFWVLSNNKYFNPYEFTTNEEGKGWINEVEGLINEKCPQADLRIENVLTNELFCERHVPEEIEKQCQCLKTVGGMDRCTSSPNKLVFQMME